MTSAEQILDTNVRIVGNLVVTGALVSTNQVSADDWTILWNMNPVQHPNAPVGETVNWVNIGGSGRIGSMSSMTAVLLTSGYQIGRLLGDGQLQGAMLTNSQVIALNHGPAASSGSAVVAFLRKTVQFDIVPA